METPILVMLCGLPGCGKSTVANAIREHFLPDRDFAIVGSDTTRKELFPNPTYSDEENEIAHRTVQERLIGHLKAGRSAIHDATNLREEYRYWRHEAVRLTGCRVLLVSVSLEDAEARRRIVARAEAGGSVSDADVAVYEMMLDSAETIPSPHAIVHTDHRFDANLAVTVAQIERLLANPDPIIRKRKVFAYITLDTRLLVFRQPNAPEAGIQVPAGTVDADEDWENAVMREAFEESGLAGLTLQRYLGEAWRDMTDYEKNELHQRRYFHLHAPQPHAESWQHWEEFGGASHNRHLFELFWVERDSVPPLIADHGYFLESL